MITIDDIKNTIIKNVTLFGFLYKRKEGNVDPSYTPQEGDSYLLFYDGHEKIVHSLDEVMNTPFFDGKTLTEIADEVTVTDW